MSRDPRRMKSHAALIAAATALIDERPLEEISVTEIAERAGVTRVTLYQQFADRDTLLQAAGVARYREALDRVTRAGPIPLHLATRAVVEHLSSNVGFYRKVLSGSCGMGTYREIQTYLEKRIAGPTVSEGRLEPDELRFLAGGAMAATVAWLDSVAQAGGTDADEVRRTADRVTAYITRYREHGPLQAR